MRYEYAMVDRTPGTPTSKRRIEMTVVGRQEQGIRLRRGRPVYGAKLGIIILDTRFQRFPGDIGYAGSFSFPVQYAVVRGISLGADLRPDEATLKKFFQAVDDLVMMGVDGISTSCGFLAIMQPDLAAYSPVPVAASSLLQIPMIERMLPKGKRVGVLTARKASLSEAHFKGVGSHFNLPIAGMSDESVFRRNLVSGNPHIDRAAQEREVLDVAAGLIGENPDIGALVLECTNLAPYSDVLEREFNRPVYDVITLLEWFHAGLRPKTYQGP